MHFYENPFTCECGKENKKLKGFQISHIYWSFSSGIMAVKGLMLLLLLIWVFFIPVVLLGGIKGDLI